ncbi:MAG: hypothetical protein ACREO3_07715 [Arenimonas sp.]
MIARSLYAEEIDARTMTRRQYDKQRALAHRNERDAALLDGYARQHGGAGGRQDRDYARAIRADLAAPADPDEAARNKRLHRLRAALLLAVQATRLRRDARAIARAA